jgi:hypothetical protein
VPDRFTLNTDRLAQAVADGSVDPDPLSQPLEAFSSLGADQALASLFSDAEDAGAIASPDGLELAVYAVGGANDLGTLIALRRNRAPLLQISGLSIDTSDLARLDATAAQALQAVCDHANQLLLPHANLLPERDAA